MKNKTTLSQLSEGQTFQIKLNGLIYLKFKERNGYFGTVYVYKAMGKNKFYETTSDKFVFTDYEYYYR
jgi:hypothetical protein